MDRKRNIVNEKLKPITRNSKRLKTSVNEISKAHFPLCSLPNELILLIMEHLSIYDKMSFGMTCRKFHNLFNSCRPLHKNKLVKVSNKNCSSFFKLFTERKNTSICRTILSDIEFFKCNINLIHETFWSEYGPDIISVTFSDCLDNNIKNVTSDSEDSDDDEEFKELDDDEILLRIFAFIPNLEQFKIQYEHAINCTKVLNKCSKLKYRKLEKIEVPKMSDYAFNNFIVNAPKLKEVKICQLPNVPQLNDLILIKSKTIPTDEGVNHENMTYENILQVLPLSKITSLGHLNYRDLLMLCTLKNNIKLEKVTLSNLFLFDERVSDQCALCIFCMMIVLFKESLKHLNLFGHIIANNDFDYYGGFPGLSKLQNLKTLTLPDRISFGNLIEIMQLKNLENLYITGGLEKFTIHGNNIQLSTVLKALPNLRKLHIDGADLYKFDSYLNSTSGLIELKLEDCKKLKMKNVFLALCKNHKSLRKLIINECEDVIKDEYICRSEIKKETRNSPAKIYEGISSLKNLTHLSLTASAITDKSIQEQFKWNELISLRLDENENITDTGLLSISKNCPALIKLELQECSNISDEGIKHLCNLTRLRELDLTGIAITEIGVNYLKNSSCPLNVCDIDDDLELHHLLKDKLNHNY